MTLLQLDYRDKALRHLKNYFYELLYREVYRQILAFQAPTGSGKTVTMACVLRHQ
jgi:superfamily II DNA or RNA helicase